jgi:hypothetical protein
MMEAVSTSETSVSFYEITQRNIPEERHLQSFLVFVSPYSNTSAVEKAPLCNPRIN